MHDAEPAVESTFTINQSDPLIKECILWSDVFFLSCVECSIFLVDHAWTYRVDHAREQLEQVPGLLARMAALMEVDFHGEVPDVSTVELVMERMWKYNQTYHLNQGVCLT